MILQHLKYLSSLNILLGSGSPRRFELLKQMGLTFNVKVSGFAEDLDKSLYSNPSDYVSETSFKKAEYIQNEINDKDIDLIICADTIIAIPGEKWTILEKPKDKENAKEMITSLSNNFHYVITGVSLILPKNPSKSISFIETTKVYFSNINEEEINEYINLEEPYDKAGGYGIQGTGGLFVDKIEGCYYNVIGLPINKLAKQLHILISEKSL